MEHEDRMILKLNTCFILMKNIELVVKNASDVWRDIYHLNKPSEETVEIKDGDSSDNEDDEDDIPSVTITTGELHALMEEKEEEEKEEEVVEEEMDEDDSIRIAVEAIASLPHTPQNIVTSMESTSTGDIASAIATSFSQSSPTTSQLQATTMEVSTTSSIKLIVTSSATKLAPSASVSPSCSVSATVCSTNFSSSILVSSSVLITTASSTLVTIPVSIPNFFSSALSVSTSTSATPSIVDTSVCTLPSIAPFLGNISVLDSVSTPIGIQTLSPISLFTASPSISTIVSVPKVKPIITEVQQRQPLKLLITSKEIEEDIDLDIEIEIPKIDFDTAIVEEMRRESQLLEKKAR